MKIVRLLLLVTWFLPATAQTERTVPIRMLQNDSVALPLNNQWQLIEDDCSSMTRYGHLNVQKKTFWGPFHDVSKINPAIILAEGTYSKEGLLEGALVIRNIDGDLMVEGNYHEGKAIGSWLLYSNGGQKCLEYQVSPNGWRVKSAWDANGKLSAQDGNGVFRSEMSGQIWEGKIENGALVTHIGGRG